MLFLFLFWFMHAQHHHFLRQFIDGNYGLGCMERVSAVPAHPVVTEVIEAVVTHRSVI
jgi:hypothetical protein